MGFMHITPVFDEGTRLIYIFKEYISYGCVSHLMNAKLPCDLFVCICFPFNFNLVSVITKYSVGRCMYFLLHLMKIRHELPFPDPPLGLLGKFRP